MATFIDCVNRVLRINRVIRDDDDDIDSFSDTQHAASVSLAMIAIQDTLSNLVSDRLIPYEEADGTITCATDTRTYALPSDFVRFKGQHPFLLELDGSDNSANRWASYYDEEKLRREILDYREQSGTPYYWYISNASTKKIGLFPVPDSTQNGVKYRFPYEKDVMVEDATDTIPFQSTQEYYPFAQMAARQFKYLVDGDTAGVEQDVVYNRAKSTLMNLLVYIDPSKRY